MFPRIISLLPSATEIVCALGYRQCLVGRSHECDYPPEVKSLPSCTRSKIDVNAPSAIIDSQIKSVVAEGLSPYELDKQLILALKPDLIITQAQCEVCAVSEKDLSLALEGIAPGTIKVISLSPLTLDDILGDIVGIGELLGAEQHAKDFVASLKLRLANGTRRNAIAAKPRVACLEWFDPLMAAGNWVPELVALAQAEDVMGTAGAHSAWLTWGDLLAANPDVIMLMPCGFDLERTKREAAILTEHPHWRALKAVQQGRVYAFDGSQYFNRPGPRIVDSFELLCEALWDGGSADIVDPVIPTEGAPVQ